MTGAEFTNRLLFLEEQLHDIRDGLNAMTPDELVTAESTLWWFKKLCVDGVGVWAVADEKRTRTKETT